MKPEIIKQNVGVDVSKDDMKVAFSILTADYTSAPLSNHRVVVRATRTFANTLKGFKQLDDWVKLKKHAAFDVHVTVEATGVYYEGMAYYLHKQGYCLHVVLPNLAKKYGQSLGLKSKTDKLDAKSLAQMGLERELRVWQPVSPHLLELKQLTRERDALVRSRTTSANQLHAYRHASTGSATVKASPTSNPLCVQANIFLFWTSK